VPAEDALVMKRLLFARLLCASPALAESSLTVGVFLPTTLADGQQRFDFGEKLAGLLGQALGVKAGARNFARYADFMDAIKQGKIDVAVVDAWIAAESGEPMPLAALGSVGGKVRRPWVVVARSGKSVSSVLGKRLALTRGAGAGDGAFVTNAVFEGALVADKQLQPTYAPSVESAMRMWSLGNAEAALLPANLAPSEARVLYQSAPLPIAAVLAQKSKLDAVKKALASVGAVPPFDGFVATNSDELLPLRKLVQSGPAARPPVWAETAPLPLDTKSLITFHGMPSVFPSFVEMLNVSKELPDD
jgi:hypothetical protein